MCFFDFAFYAVVLPCLVLEWESASVIYYASWLFVMPKAAYVFLVYERTDIMERTQSPKAAMNR